MTEAPHTGSVVKGSGKTKEEIAAAYDSPPWWYDVRGFFILTFAYNSNILNQLRFFSPNMGEKHLEVACGTGTLLELILKWRKWKKMPESKIIGLDYAEAMLAGAIERFKNESSVELVHADAADMPFEDETFDSANIANSFHSFPSVAGALSEIFRVLKPGGALRCNVLLYPRTVPPFKQIARNINDWGIRKGILYTPYTKDEVIKLMEEAGFEITQHSISGNCLNIEGRKAA